MEIITSLEQLHKFSAPCVVALGTFDGLHRGHLDVIETARDKAHECNSQLAVFTFSNHPFEWIRPGMVPPALITGAVPDPHRNSAGAFAAAWRGCAGGHSL